MYNRATGKKEIRVFRDIIEYLRAGDVLVLNNTRVMRARLSARKVGDASGRVFEILLCKLLGENEYEVLLKPAKKLKVGDSVVVESVSGVLLSKNELEGTARMRFDGDVERFGEMPLPHYIKRGVGEACESDETRYQTVYASDEKAGSCAAPTAGLHWTEELLGRARGKGVEIVEVLLHVGIGTFRPIKVDDILEHKMHAEYFEVSAEAAERIGRAKREGRRVICVGTTAVRTVESVADSILGKAPGAGRAKPPRPDGAPLQGGERLVGDTSIFIYPGYRFRVVDAMVTNFHLPKSTLLVLVSAFLGREKALELYKFAVGEKMRFYSFGDACFFE